ncbi:FecR family protein [Pedobacter sp. P26]|uniref:FecR family protein n=1 Tax=Pedobacter sp. P26 TaxID=3423956 RepID=UPI003D674278
MKVSIAASIALAVFLGHYIYQTGKKSADQSIVSADINPGKVAATLTLSNGKKIYIADVKGRNVAEESGVKITKNENGELVYTIIDNKQESGKMQTLTTYRGETQVLVLPDGSKVWLNAASSIKYPSSFAAASKRRVELAGEAYFEIAKDKSHPFIVATDKQEVEVLGTHFNINSYHDETMVKTTLLEGSIQVSTLGGQAKVLKPGEQSTLSGANLIRISEVDVDDVVAWKNGFFVFEDESVEDVMKQLARWYNVEVKYNSDDLKHKKFSGSISRYYKVSQVLDKLAKIGLVGFKLENRTIFVENKSK